MGAAAIAARRAPSVQLIRAQRKYGWLFAMWGIEKFDRMAQGIIWWCSGMCGMSSL